MWGRVRTVSFGEKQEKELEKHGNGQVTGGDPETGGGVGTLFWSTKDREDSRISGKLVG